MTVLGSDEVWKMTPVPAGRQWQVHGRDLASGLAGIGYDVSVAWAITITTATPTFLPGIMPTPQRAGRAPWRLALDLTIRFART